MNKIADTDDSQALQDERSEAVLAELDRILQSKQFVGAARMRSFLSYVVKETLAGNQDEIRAKTIAMDVYGYDPEEVMDREGVVRVDASRLRRKLEQVYAEDDEMRSLKISLPMGGYSAQFDDIPEDPSETNEPQKSNRTPIIWAAAILGLLAIGVTVYWTIGNRDLQVAHTSTEDRSTYYDIAPARVEAVNLAEAGRDLIFPAPGETRLNLALSVFEEAIAKDATYFGGFAGAAQVQALKAILLPHLDENALLQDADANSARALEIAPQAAWALSARAWWSFANGDFEIARFLSQKAVEMQPDDPHTIEFDALISLYTLDYDKVLASEKTLQSFAKQGQGNVFLNALGAAKFHTGDYRGAIKVFEDNIALGGAFGPVGMSYLTASHAMAGDLDTARALAENLTATWPGFDLDRLKHRTFISTQPADQLGLAMSLAGWTGPVAPSDAQN